MRKIALAAIFLALYPLGARPASLQQTGPTERIPNSDPVNIYPRWLGWVAPYVSIGPLANGIGAWAYGNGGLTFALDSGGSVHTVNVNRVKESTHSGETGALEPGWDFHVEYKNDRYESRFANGFSDTVVMDDTFTTFNGGPTFQTVTSPAICVDSSDNIHIAWVHVWVTSGATTSSAVYYRKKTSAGWSTVVNLTPSVPANTLFDSLSIKVTAGGLVHVLGRSNNLNALGNQYCTFSLATNRTCLVDIIYSGGIATTYTIPETDAALAPAYFDSGSQTYNQYYSTVPGWYRSDVSNPRLLLDSSGQPWIVWERFMVFYPAYPSGQQAFYTEVYSSRGSGSSWTAPASFAGDGSATNNIYNHMPDFALDASDNPHYVWRQSTASSAETGSIKYKSPGGAVSSPTGSTLATNGAVLLDSRAQVHVMWKENNALYYAARVNNPGPGLDLTWRTQLPAVQDLNIPQIPGFSTKDPLIRTVAISKNDQIHVAGNLYYTRTTELGVGVRDPAAMVGLFPGASLNVASGNVHYELPLFSFRGEGPTQSCGLIYDSLDPYLGSMSPGWKLNYDVYLIDHAFHVNNGGTTNEESVTVVLPGGRPIRFYMDQTHAVLLPEIEFGDFSKLARVITVGVGGGYLLYRKSGELWVFNGWGKLKEIIEPNGNYLHINFVPSGSEAGGMRILDVVDMLGNGGTGRESSGIIYEDRTNQLLSPRPTAIAGPFPVYFNYTGRFLTSVSLNSGPDAPVYGFDYSSANNSSTKERVNQLRQVRSPRGQAANPQYGWTLKYLPDGRLTQVDDPSEVYLLDGEPDATAPTAHVASLMTSYDETLAINTPRRTTITDRRSAQSRFVVDARRSLALEIHDPTVLASAPGISPVIRTFDQYGNLTDVQDRWGFHTTYTYFLTGATPEWVKDNLKEVYRPKDTGSGQDLVASYTYTTDGWNKVATATTNVTPTEGSSPVPRVTTYSYDAYGRVTQVLYPDVMRPDGTAQTNVTRTYTYDGARRSLSRIVNEEGNGVTYSDFDTVHTLPKSVLADGGTQPETFIYDAIGGVTHHTAPRGGPSNDAPLATITDRDGIYRVYSVTDPAGQMTSFEYDRDSHVIGVYPPAGGITTTTFDKRGLVSGGSSPDGSWSQVVDANGKVRRSINERGFANNRTLDSLGRVTEIRSPGASTLGAGQGGGGPAIHTTQFVRDGFSGTEHFSTVTEVGAQNRVTKTTYDARGRAKEVMEPDLVTKHQTIYDELDQVVATQNLFNGSLQTCSVSFRDARDRVYRVRTQDQSYAPVPLPPQANQQSRFTLYNKAGSVFQTVDPLGDVTTGGWANKTTYLRDLRERVRHVIDGKGVIVAEHTYGDDNLIIETKVPNPATKTSTLTTASTRTYTARKEVKSQLDASGNGMSYTYNQLHGQVATTTDAAGIVNRTLYDPVTQHPTTIIEAEGTVDESRTLQVWTNGLNTQTKVYNPATTQYDATFTRTYDQAGRLERLESPTVTQTQIAPERFFYNEFGQSSQHIVGTKTVTNSYNALGQNTQTQWTGAFSAMTTRTYNGAGFQETISDGSKSKTMLYDVWKGTPSTESIAVGGSAWKVQTHAFDAAGNQTGFGDGEGGQHGWPVDENNRPTQMTYKPLGQSEAVLRQITYTPGGLVDKETLKSAAGATIATTTHTYDSLGNRKGSQTVKAGTNEILTDYAWDYDARRQITGIHPRHLGASFSMTVDGKGRTKTQSTSGNNNGNAAPPFTNQFGAAPTGNVSAPSEEASGVPHTVLPVAAKTATYTFHPSGNRATETVDSVVTNTYTHNAANQLTLETKPGGITTEHAYDQWGNETTRTHKLNGSVQYSETYGYNHLNLMSSYINSQTGANWQYDFYPTGERYAKTNMSNSTSELYAPRGDDVATEYQKIGAGAATLKNAYVQGLGIDQKQLRIASDGARRHLLGDQVGTIAMTLDDTGGVSSTVLRDAWGVYLNSTGESERYGGIAQREIDTESGLVHMRHRMYDPALGRFTQRDPLLESVASEHYNYASNTPTTFKDPQGLFRTSLDLGFDPVEDIYARSVAAGRKGALGETGWSLHTFSSFYKTKGGKTITDSPVAFEGFGQLTGKLHVHLPELKSLGGTDQGYKRILLKAARHEMKHCLALIILSEVLFGSVESKIKETSGGFYQKYGIDQSDINADRLIFLSPALKAWDTAHDAQDRELDSQEKAGEYGELDPGNRSYLGKYFIQGTYDEEDWKIWVTRYVNRTLNAVVSGKPFLRTYDTSQTRTRIDLIWSDLKTRFDNALIGEQGFTAAEIPKFRD